MVAARRASAELSRIPAKRWSSWGYEQRSVSRRGEGKHWQCNFRTGVELARSPTLGAAGYNLHSHRTPWTRAVEFHKEYALPRAKDKAALMDWDHEIAPNDPGSEMRSRVVVHAVMAVLGLGQQIAHNCLKVLLQSGLIFVDKYARGCM